MVSLCNEYLAGRTIPIAHPTRHSVNRQYSVPSARGGTFMCRDRDRVRENVETYEQEFVAQNFT